MSAAACAIRCRRATGVCSWGGVFLLVCVVCLVHGVPLCVCLCAIVLIALHFHLLFPSGTSQVAGSASKTGVSQVLNRLSFASTLSHLRRLNTPLARDGKLARPRQLHNTHWGMVCPAETPEGHACGLVKSLSLMAYITVGADARMVHAFLADNNVEGLEDISATLLAQNTVAKVLVNGAWVGIHRHPAELAKTIRTYRRDTSINFDTSVIWDIAEKELRIATDAGRICRPLFIVDQMRLKYGPAARVWCLWWWVGFASLSLSLSLSLFPQANQPVSPGA